MISLAVKRKCLDELGMKIKMDAVGTDVEFVEDEDGVSYDLTGMSDADVLDMLKRSVEIGRNLFFEERPAIKDEYNSDVLI